MQDIAARKRSRLLAAACAGVAAVSLFASDGLLRGAALVGAAIEMPQGAGSLIMGEAPAPGSPALGGRGAIDPAGAIVPLDTLEAMKTFDLKAIPGDIRALMEEAAEEFANQKRDGDIREKTYGPKDATDRWGSLAVRNTTETQQGRDLTADLAAPLDLQIDKSRPAVLIFHTHTTEAFEILERPWYAQDWTARTENAARSIVRVGEEMAKVLERAGFQVIHDTTIYDRAYTGAYDKSRVAVLKCLEDNPSVRVTLDVHRDAIHTNNGVRIKPVAEIGGKKAAQVMIITGAEEGNVTNYPDWERNLAFATQLHMAAEERYPELMRPLFFCQRKYNMDVTPFSLLLEMGADVNTLDEAIYAGRLIGDSLARLLEKFTKN